VRHRQLSGQALREPYTGKIKHASYFRNNAGNEVPQLARVRPVDDRPVEWSFLTKHGRALLCIARDPDVRLRDVAANLGITERRAYAIVVDLTRAGYVVKTKDGRRNRYEVQAHMPLPEPDSRERAIGEVLDLLGNSRTRPADAVDPRATPVERRRA
jgi:hypothetical protein